VSARRSSVTGTRFSIHCTRGSSADPPTTANAKLPAIQGWALGHKTGREFLVSTAANLFFELGLKNQADDVPWRFQRLCMNTPSGGWRAELGHRPLRGYSGLSTELCGDFVRILLRGDVLRGHETDSKFVDWSRTKFAEHLFYRTLHSGGQFI
jgi:hypothetical protein